MMAQTRQPLPPLRRAGGDGSTGVVGPSRCGANGRVSAGLTALRGVSTVSIARKYGLLGDTSFTRRILTDARTENPGAALITRSSGRSWPNWAVARICQLPQEEVCWHCLSTD